MTSIGLSGYQYADWRGVFYPGEMPRSDYFSFYTQHFPAVEILSTYRIIPEPEFLERLGKRCPEGFKFFIKAPREFSVELEFLDSAVDLFQEAIEPLKRSGKLGAVFVEFPYTFEPTPEHLEYIAHLKDFITPPVAIEFFNAAWNTPETIAMLKQRGITLISHDVPALRGLFPPLTHATTNTLYLRLHGRNKARWFRHDSLAEHYTYAYSGQELSEIAAWIRRTKKNKSYLFFHNYCPSVENAQRMQTLLP